MLLYKVERTEMKNGGVLGYIQCFIFLYGDSTPLHRLFRATDVSHPGYRRCPMNLRRLSPEPTAGSSDEGC